MDSPELQIIVYGHGGKSDPDCESDDTFCKYISDLIFTRDDSRYRYTQRKDADVIVLSMGGRALGHFIVGGREEPTDADRNAYPKVKCVYLVESSVVYANPVSLSSLGISGIQFGKKLSATQFSEITRLARVL